MSIENIKRVKQLLSTLKVDAVLVTKPENVRYLTGFTGSEGSLLVGSRIAHFFSDSRYTLQAKDEVKGAKVNIFTSKIKSIAKVLSRTKVKRLGIEGDVMTVNMRMSLTKGLKGVRLVPLGGQIDELRIAKSPKEVEALRNVIALSEKAFKKVKRKLKPGVIELDFAKALDMEMIRLGAEGMAFETIVASGYRGALPHGIASEKVVKAGELVVIDYGAKLNGYFSDQTVTLPMGKISKEAKKIHRIVYDAQRTAIDAARPGITGKDLDLAARKVIDDAGYGKYFGHGLGHGVGLEVHELPRASRLYPKKLDVGHVVTIEPGIYIEGKLGVRLEDMILITDDGCEVLTSLDKKLRG